MGQLSMELYLKQLRLRYKKASRSEKTTILQEFCDTSSGYHRKHAIRTLNEKIHVKKKVKKRGRKPNYKPELILEPLNRPQNSNKAWASDITYIHTNEGRIYLATVIDLYNRKIVGWSIGTRLVTQLIADALTMAIRRCKPTQGVIHHSDRGSQYCSDVYTQHHSKS
jgi:transposase InsO family protein